jgi:hypothetical protein
MAIVPSAIITYTVKPIVSPAISLSLQSSTLQTKSNTANKADDENSID